MRMRHDQTAPVRGARRARCATARAPNRSRVDGRPPRLVAPEIQRLPARNGEFSRDFGAQVDLHRSLARHRVTIRITLKMIIYKPTGAPVTAPHQTARAAQRRAQLGLPLHLDRRRLVLAVRAAWPGLRRGGQAFAAWLRDASEEYVPGTHAEDHVPGRRNSDLTEEPSITSKDAHGSRPVRIGDSAADQLQLDVYGEMLDAAYLGDVNGLHVSRGLTAGIADRRLVVRRLATARRGHLETAAGNGTMPPTAGSRAGWRRPRHADSPNQPASDLARWAWPRDAVYSGCCPGLDSEVGAFTQPYTARPSTPAPAADAAARVRRLTTRCGCPRSTR